MKLFDDIAHEYEGPALYAEPSFYYLNRSNRPAAERIRVTLEEWFTRYPTTEQADIRGRFRSNNARHHHSAFFELLIHELLLRMDCAVDVHPSAPDDEVTKRPDFLVTSPGGSCCYIEAVLATAESASESAARARMNEVYDVINRLDSPNFFVGVDITGAPATPPPAKRIRTFLKTRLDELDPNEIAKHWESGSFRAVPHWLYEHEGWIIDFYPIPKSPKLRGKSGVRPIGMLGTEAKFVDSSTPLRNAITEKAGRYGDLELPYVIAVDALDDAIVDRIDIMEALFGKEQYTIEFGQTGIASEPRMSRVPNGAWIDKSGPRHTRVSAALVAVSLIPWSVGSTHAYLVHNPWAQKPYSSPLTRLSQGIPEGGRMNWQEGEALHDLLGLPPGWPILSPGD